MCSPGRARCAHPWRWDTALRNDRYCCYYYCKPSVPGEVEFKQAKKAEKEAKKAADKKEAAEKRTFKGTAKAVTLAKQLSPRTQRKNEKLLNNTSQLKVSFVFCCPSNWADRGCCWFRWKILLTIETFKETAKADTLAKQLSPRTKRRKEKLLNKTSRLKVSFVYCCLWNWAHRG